MTGHAAVSIVVLSYNRPDLLAEALTSIAAQSRRPTEVLVVDNRGPRSDEIARVAARFPDFRLLANPDNRGFTGGMNTGLRASTGQYVLLTEDDIVLAPDALEKVARHLDENPAVDLAGAVIFNKTAGTIRSAGGTLELGPIFKLRFIGEGTTGPPAAAPYSVSFLPGCFILGRRDLLGRIGGFWEELYMYYDDVDLCIRALEDGARIDVVPAAVVWHFEPPESPVPGWLIDMKLRNFLWLYVRHARIDVLLLFVARYYLVGTIRALASDRRLARSLIRALFTTAIRLPRLLALRSGLSSPL